MANDSSTGGPLAPTQTTAPQDTSFDAVLQSWVAGITGLPGNLVRPRWQQVPPAQPEVGTDWAAVGVTREVPDAGLLVSGHNPNANGGTGDTTTKQQVTVEILSSFYGPNAYGYASLLGRGMLVGQNREALQLLGMNVVGAPDDMRFVGELINQKNQRRADLAFRMRVNFIDVWPILSLLSAEGTVYPDRGSEEFTAPPAGMPGS